MIELSASEVLSNCSVKGTALSPLESDPVELLPVFYNKEQATQRTALKFYSTHISKNVICRRKQEDDIKMELR
jgi:hypothetical protein